jgi:cytochrome c oxidase subunit 3
MIVSGEMQQDESSSGEGEHPHAISIGLIAALSAITMLFAAFTSAYVVRRGLGDDWMPLNLPRVVLLTPILLIADSILLESGWRRRTQKKVYQICYLAALLGTLFLAAQVYAWMYIANGVRISAHPAASFFCIFSGSFSVFVFGGIIALLRSGLRGARGVLPSQNIIYYWHYLSGLWMYLLGLLYWGK